MDRGQQLAKETTAHAQDLRFLGATIEPDGGLRINMPKYHAVHRCAKHRATPWRTQDLDACVPCLREQIEARDKDVVILQTEYKRLQSVLARVMAAVDTVGDSVASIQLLAAHESHVCEDHADAAAAIICALEDDAEIRALLHTGNELSPGLVPQETCAEAIARVEFWLAKPGEFALLVLPENAQAEIRAALSILRAHAPRNTAPNTALNTAPPPEGA